MCLNFTFAYLISQCQARHRSTQITIPISIPIPIAFPNTGAENSDWKIERQRKPVHSFTRKEGAGENAVLYSAGAASGRFRGVNVPESYTHKHVLPDISINSIEGYNLRSRYYSYNVDNLYAYGNTSTYYNKLSIQAYPPSIPMYAYIQYTLISSGMLPT